MPAPPVARDDKNGSRCAHRYWRETADRSRHRSAASCWRLHSNQQTCRFDTAQSYSPIRNIFIDDITVSGSINSFFTCTFQRAGMFHWWKRRAAAVKPAPDSAVLFVLGRIAINVNASLDKRRKDAHSSADHDYAVGSGPSVGRG